MKLNKKKLIALGLSALMCVSPLSSVAFAEELSDGSAEEVVVVEEELGAGEAVAEVLPAVGEVKEGLVLDPDSVVFHYNETGDNALPDFSVTFDRKNDKTNVTEHFVLTSDGSEGDGKKWAKIQKQVEPDCENPAYMWMEVSIDDVTIVSKSAFSVKGTKALGHDYKITRGIRGIFDFDGECYSVVYDLYECQRTNCPCKPEDHVRHEVFNALDASPKADGYIRRDAIWSAIVEHDWQDPQTVIITADDWAKATAKMQAIYAPIASKLGSLKNTMKDDAGNVAVIDDATSTGTYAVVKIQVCERFDTHVKILDYKEESITPKVVEAYVTSVDSKTIANPSVLQGKYMFSDQDLTKDQLIPSYDDVELKNCTIPGTFVVTYFSKDGVKVAEKTFTIPASAAEPHHYHPFYSVEFKSPDDAVLCTVTYNADGTVKSVVSNSCYKPVDYFVVKHCSAAGCPCKTCAENGKYYDEEGDLIVKTSDGHKHQIERVAGTAQPTGSHIINAEAYRKIEAYGASLTVEEYNDLIKYAGDAKNQDKLFIKVTDNAKCVTEGTVIVEFLCISCRQIQAKYTKTLTVAPLGHNWPEIAQIEYVVRPTCENEGSFNRVWTCKRCGEVKKEENIRAPRLPHTNELYVYQDNKGNDLGENDYANRNNNAVEVIFVGDIVVDYNGYLKPNMEVKATDAALSRVMPAGVKGTYAITVGGDTVNAPGFGSIAGANQATKDYVVYAYLGTRCANCGKHEVALKSTASDKMTSLKITSLTPNGKDGNPGSISLVATYVEDGKTKTSPTYKFDYFTDVNDYQARTVDNRTTSDEKIDPELTAKDINVVIGKTAEAGIVYDGYGDISYESADPTIATVDAKGVITGVKAGSTTITVKLDGTARYNPASTTFKVDVRPVGTVIYRLFDEGEGTLRVYWRAVEGVDGIQYAWATDADFSDVQKSREERAVNNQRRFNLDAATYYVKVRTYVYDENGKRVYSTWSSAKTIDLGIHLAAPSLVKCEVRPSGSVEFKVAKTSNEDGYQLAYSNDGGQTWKTSSSYDTTFIRKLGTGSFKVRVRSFVETGYGRYYSAWYEAGTVTIQ